MIDPFDDLGTAKSPFKVVACIPIYGRGPLLPHTIGRLLKKNDVYKVICVGDQHQDRKICEAAGAHWVHYRNKPLGAKWNVAFAEAKKFNPDACLYVGSSDWLSDNWIHLMRPYLEKHNFVGTPGCHFLDINSTLRLCNWKGYTNNRKNETIGIGRLLSADLLSKLHWRPFNDVMDRSLDWSMKINASKYGITDFMVRDQRLKAVSLSTNQWGNKHSFEDHWSGSMARDSEKINNVKEFLDLNFPEAFHLYENIASVRV